MNTTMSASSMVSTGSEPRPSSMPAIRSESCLFIWQPKVWMQKRVPSKTLLIAKPSNRTAAASTMGAIAAAPRGSTAKRMAVRYSPSMTMSAKEGMQQISMPTGERNPREMATAFTAWFTAPAPTA